MESEIAVTTCGILVLGGNTPAYGGNTVTVENRNGAWVITDIIGDSLVTRTYIFYTKAEAIRLFKQETKRSK